MTRAIYYMNAEEIGWAKTLIKDGCKKIKTKGFDDDVKFIQMAIEDQFKKMNSLQKQIHKLEPHPMMWLPDYLEKVKVDFTYASNNLEGNRISHGQIITKPLDVFLWGGRENLLNDSAEHGKPDQCGCIS